MSARWKGAPLALLVALIVTVFAHVPSARAERMPPEQVLQTWYRLVLELVRHTPNYSPPVASRSFAYLGVTAYESVAGEHTRLVSLQGQLNDLKDLPSREAGAVYDDAIVLNAAMTVATRELFNRTGPTGQHAFSRMSEKMHATVTDGMPADVVRRSADFGTAMATAILKWSQGDGGAVVENMGFPLEYTLKAGPGRWVPTSLIRQQQVPLLPDWGKNRPFAMPEGSSCRLPAPPEYSEDKASVFYREAVEVHDVVKGLTKEQKAIARFWSDDPMLSPTPPGHWVSIGWEVLEADRADLATTVDVMARLGVAVADAFIGCWDTKFEFNLVRPVSYIKKTMDPKWEPLLITPPFPEYPSGHSTQSGAAAVVLASLFGEKKTFTDSTHEADGLAPRTYGSFWEAAEEAALSRLYGGIHFRSAIERGLEQGKCVGAHVVALKTRM
ncbi:vanadium-dependent haloperoxidase [Gellertiella hungarica]|uniref:Phosphatidic acid phosphatase type 2/haloperoxidase domain-containing protein n=1 Tax=Gellertiella hungarica TaxID=1572859 RepID=A0A7W6J9G0_9HYPH|nr:vanadium-dependent haloperoxidase [Gellertiella hungarica]MBB4067231.1 hypothetical protein [Gellertiella hungarica]